MTSTDTLSAGELHATRQDHLGRQIDTQHGWRVISDVRMQPEPGAAVIVELASGEPDYEVIAVWPDRLVSVRDDGLETGNCFGVDVGGRIVETFRLRDHAHCGLIDRERGMATVVVICPEHPYYLAEECRDCGPEHLEAVLAAEDRADDDLLDEERRTCHHCRAWAIGDKHLASAQHQAFIARAFNLSTLPRSA